MFEELIKRIERLEYHQKLLIKLLHESGEEESFTKLVIQKNLGPSEVYEFHQLCECMSKKMEERKADGFLNFRPLLKEFSGKLNKKLDVRETIAGCRKENLYPELMEEFSKYD